MLADVVSLEFEGEEVSRTLLGILTHFNNVTVSSEATKNDLKLALKHFFSVENHKSLYT